MRKLFLFGLVPCLLGLAVVLSSCGATSSPESSPTTSPAPSSGVSVSGVVTASQSDLAQLGATTLGVKANSTENKNFLKSKGFTDASIRAMNLVPLAVSDTTISVGTLNSDGSMTEVASASVASDGSYSLDIDNYDSNKTYGAVVTKTSGQKTLEMKTIYPAASSGSITSTDAGISPQTTLVAQMIIEKVVKVLTAANIDPQIIANVKNAIIAAVDALIQSGTITLTAVRDATASENQSMQNAVNRASNNTTINNKLASLKGALGLSKATDLATAKGAIRELFKTMTGDPKAIPEQIIEAFAQSFLQGVTKTTAELTQAINNALINPSNQQAINGSFTSSQVATEIEHMLSAVYTTGISQQGAPPAGVQVVIDAVFPKASWKGKTITDSTSFSVPQILLLIHVGDQIAAQSNLIFNPPKAAYEMGLMSGVQDKVMIMHSDIRILSFEDWENTQPGQQPQAIRALASFVEIGNVINPTPGETDGYTCYLEYPTSGGSNTVQYSAQSFQPAPGQMGPPPGWKMFDLNPWGMGPGQTGTKVTDFTGGTATITVKDASGNVIATKSLTLVDIDLTQAVPDLLVPKQAWIGDPDISSFPKGSQPTFSWQTGTLPSIPSGYRLGYVIEVRKGTITTMNGQAHFESDWGNPDSRIFESWEKHDFPPAQANDLFNWIVPAAIDSDSVCEIGIGIVAIDSSTNMPVAEGPRRGALFVVGSPNIPQGAQQNFNYQGPPDISNQILTLEGKVHENILNDGRFSGGTLLVGLFKEGYDPSAGFSRSAVSGVTPVSLTDVGQSYKPFSLEFSGSVFGTDYGMYQVMLWKDDNGNGTFDSSEIFEHCVKGIDHRQDGTWAHWPSGGDQLVNTQSDFNFLYWGDSF